VLIADSVSVKGRHDLLVSPTSLQVTRGEVHLVVADPQISRTALALALSGRMKPSTGTVSWGHADSLKTLRQHTALLDSPEVNEPESHMKVRDLIAEDLALLPGPIWKKPRNKKWTALHGFDDVAKDWADSLDPARRLELQLLLAAEDSRIELIVLDSPDRHDMQDDVWLDLLLEFAGSNRAFAIVAIVSNAPYEWDGPITYLGSNEYEEFESPEEATALISGEPLVEEPEEPEELEEPEEPENSEAPAELEEPDKTEVLSQESVQNELDLDVPETVEPKSAEQESTPAEHSDAVPTVAEDSDAKEKE